MYLGIDKHFEGDTCPAGWGNYCGFTVTAENTAYDGAKISEAMSLWLETMDIKDATKRASLASAKLFVDDGTKVLIETSSAGIGLSEGNSLRNLKEHRSSAEICSNCQFLAAQCLKAHIRPIE